MALTLTIDGARWDAHQRALLAEVPGLVTVAKGNGYGFGLELLAARAGVLDEPLVADVILSLDVLPKILS